MQDEYTATGKNPVLFHLEKMVGMVGWVLFTDKDSFSVDPLYGVRGRLYIKKPAFLQILNLKKSRQ